MPGALVEPCQPVRFQKQKFDCFVLAENVSYTCHENCLEDRIMLFVQFIVLALLNYLMARGIHETTDLHGQLSVCSA